MRKGWWGNDKWLTANEAPVRWVLFMLKLPNRSREIAKGTVTFIGWKCYWVSVARSSIKFPVPSRMDIHIHFLEGRMRIPLQRMVQDHNIGVPGPATWGEEKFFIHVCREGTV